MAENSAIGWTDNTINFWHGCTKVSPACALCYAEKLDNRYSSVSHWGSGTPRRRTSENNRNQLQKWSDRAAKTGYMPKVFAFSMGDVFDNEVPDEWRNDFFDRAREAKNVRLQILTKRIGNAPKMLPGDFAENFGHVGLMATIPNQEEADRDIPKLLRLKVDRNVRWVGISVEPMLGPIDLQHHGWLSQHEQPALDWVIIGGESGSLDKVRPFSISAARDLMAQCQRFDTAVFMKQFGRLPTHAGKRVMLRDTKGEDWNEWASDMRVRQFPEYLDGNGEIQQPKRKADEPQPSMFEERAS
jgi:protein gp37